MRRVLYTVLLATTMAFTTPANAFDIGGLVTSAVKEAVKEEVHNTAKEVTKEAAKEAASAAGIEGADKVIDYTADNATNIQGSAANLSAAKSLATDTHGIGAVSGALSAASIAASEANTLSNGATPADQFKREYMAITTKMSHCGADNACISKYQQQLINLQKRGNDYVAKTGDANYDGKTDGIDAQINATMENAKAAQKAAKTRPSSGGYNE